MTSQERIDKFKEYACRAELYKVVGDIDAFAVHLDYMGYFDAPASAHHHGTKNGDLFMHSLKVAEILDDYTKRLDLKWVRPQSPAIVGLFHDICKIDQYVLDKNGHWEFNERQLVPGHGDKSVMILSTLMVLTVEEMMCIRHHMGAYKTDEWEQFDLAIRRFSNVLYTHTADMAASKIFLI